MTINAAFSPTTGVVPAATAGPMLGRSQTPGPFTITKELDPTASDGSELTPESTAAGHWRLCNPVDGTACYYWMGQTNRVGDVDPAVAVGNAVLLSPGDTEYPFVPFGWKIVVADSIPAP